jgi:hypothetical protein
MFTPSLASTATNQQKKNHRFNIDSFYAIINKEPLKKGGNNMAFCVTMKVSFGFRSLNG